MRFPIHRAHYVVAVIRLGILVACLGLTGYVVMVLGISRLWGTGAWWQSILIWFLGSLLLHDAIMYPIYTLADRALLQLPARQAYRPRAVNHIRIPVLASGLCFIVFLPGIIGHGSHTYLAATGQTQAPFLSRWLLLCGTFFAISAVIYAIRLWSAHRSR